MMTRQVSYELVLFTDVLSRTINYLHSVLRHWQSCKTFQGLETPIAFEVTM